MALGKAGEPIYDIDNEDRRFDWVLAVICAIFLFGIGVIFYIASHKPVPYTTNSQIDVTSRQNAQIDEKTDGGNGGSKYNMNVESKQEIYVEKQKDTKTIKGEKNSTNFTPAPGFLQLPKNKK